MYHLNNLVHFDTQPVSSTLMKEPALRKSINPQSTTPSQIQYNVIPTIINKTSKTTIRSSITCMDSGLPHYVVPVLYVPQRCLTNEELSELPSILDSFQNQRTEQIESEIPCQSTKLLYNLTDTEKEIYENLMKKMYDTTSRSCPSRTSRTQSSDKFYLSTEPNLSDANTEFTPDADKLFGILNKQLRESYKPVVLEATSFNSSSAPVKFEDKVLKKTENDVWFKELDSSQSKPEQLRGPTLQKHLEEPGFLKKPTGHLLEPFERLQEPTRDLEPTEFRARNLEEMELHNQQNSATISTTSLITVPSTQSAFNNLIQVALKDSLTIEKLYGTLSFSKQTESKATQTVMKKCNSSSQTIPLQPKKKLVPNKSEKNDKRKLLKKKNDADFTVNIVTDTKGCLKRRPASGSTATIDTDTKGLSVKRQLASGIIGKIKKGIKTEKTDQRSIDIQKLTEKRTRKARPSGLIPI